MDHVELRGLRIAYQRRGDGPPLVLLHGGFGFDSRSWRRQIDSLSDEFAVVAWDAPGSGQSSDPPGTFRLPDFADCLADFITALGLMSPHIAGLSAGAALALELYRGHPTVPRTLVLAGAYAGWAGSLPREVVDARLQRALREQVDEVMALMCAVHPAGNVTGLRAMAEADLRDVLPRIMVPTLLLYGEADKRSPLSVGEELHARIPGSTLVTLPGVGHLCNVEGADQFNREVRAFFRDHSG